MHINILGYRCEVREMPGDVLHALGVDGATLPGGAIVIADDLNHEERRETLLHELLHKIWERQDIGFATRTEERVVTKLAEGLADVLTNNDSETIRQIFT